MHADSHSNFEKWRTHFCHLVNVLGTSNVRHIKRHTDKPLVPKPCAFEFKMVTGNLKRNKSQGTDQIQAELLQSGRRAVHFQISKLINSVRTRMTCLDSRTINSLHLFITNETQQFVVIIKEYRSYQLHVNVIQNSTVKINSMYSKNCLV
jgi:hypothetical protein